MYLHDERSARFCAWRRRITGSLPITRFAWAELVNSFSLAVHHGLIEAEAADAARTDLEADIEHGGLTLVDTLWRRTLDLTRELSRRHSARIGTRTLDVLHVASAITLEATHLVTYDVRQTALARAVPLRVLAP